MQISWDDRQPCDRLIYESGTVIEVWRSVFEILLIRRSVDLRCLFWNLIQDLPGSRSIRWDECHALGWFRVSDFGCFLLPSANSDGTCSVDMKQFLDWSAISHWDVIIHAWMSALGNTWTCVHEAYGFWITKPARSKCVMTRWRRRDSMDVASA